MYWIALICLVSVVAADDWTADEVSCPTDTSRWITQPFVPWGVPYRAHKTMPPELELRESTIQGAGLGIFSRTFIAKNTWLGEYEGEGVFESNNTGFTFQIFRNGDDLLKIDSTKLETSGWTRWMNTPRHDREENVVYKACKGKVLFITKKDIIPGEELMFYYGDAYSYQLGIVYQGWATQALLMAQQLEERFKRTRSLVHP